MAVLTRNVTSRPQGAGRKGQGRRIQSSRVVDVVAVAKPTPTKARIHVVINNDHSSVISIDSFVVVLFRKTVRRTVLLLLLSLIGSGVQLLQRRRWRSSSGGWVDASSTKEGIEESLGFLSQNLGSSRRRAAGRPGCAERHTLGIVRLHHVAPGKAVPFQIIVQMDQLCTGQIASVERIDKLQLRHYIVGQGSPIVQMVMTTIGRLLVSRFLLFLFRDGAVTPLFLEYPFGTVLFGFVGICFLVVFRNGPFWNGFVGLGRHQCKRWVGQRD